MGGLCHMIQREERNQGVETLTHQKWSGSELGDAYPNTVTGGTASTAIMGAGVTETQFGAKSKIPQATTTEDTISVEDPSAKPAIYPVAVGSKRQPLTVHSSMCG